MTFKEFAGVKSCDIDLITGEKVSHKDKYRRVITKLGGVEAVKPYLPCSLYEIKEALNAGDEHLNSIRLARWDRAAGYSAPFGSCNNMSHGEYGVQRLLYSKGCTCYSCSEIVCLLKETARWLAEGGEN